MLSLLIANWRWVLMGLLLAALGIQTWRLGNAEDALESVQTAYSEYRGGVKALGEAAAKRAALQALRDLQDKERADDEAKRNTDRFTADIGRLRQQLDNARRSTVPPAPTGSKCPDGQACFDRADLERALGKLLADVRGLADEGSKVVIDLDSAKRWANSR